MDKLLIALLFSLLLPQVLFSQIQWSSKNALGRSTSECAVADFDGDGFNDIAVAGATQRWYKGPTFTNFYTIGTSDGGPYAAPSEVTKSGQPSPLTSAARAA
ncbi:MAG: FG-GAP repeat protein [Bacteroidota bacterium]